MPPYRARLSIYELTSDPGVLPVTLAIPRTSSSGPAVETITHNQRCSEKSTEDDGGVALACSRIKELEEVSVLTFFNIRLL